ncbi:deoxyribose-phosphate aldolase [Mycolicibacterium aichiense]|uniref:Deoxyribose-phosphate aldolase n=1 Tax=Mycolicibacterium aichiense TaxID=1799 RepID=A0AAD1MEM3_9MYCO|nr:deoxyribose-phosphate aldolase [Mycolicibacterium aichiense]MCV7016140.1 deoxyribose-phosphate aldolase [Mycolicibacterium aichiense]BBX10096.1 deoxyribose-phosphate aldolase [Mycolicibacterium aichiense]STZ26238.1 Deoxyribose-phosphate aldolase [Mycolicibacterium aichiense]
MPTRGEVAALVDHTLLKPEATDADVIALVDEAVALGVLAVCVSPSMVSVAVKAASTHPESLVVAAVAGFPSGKHLPAIKAQEARAAVDDGATEIDMVIDVGAALAGDIAQVAADIATVRSAVPGAVLKVIVESAALLSLADDNTLVAVCRAAEESGADFVKTSTGFHPAGGASVVAIEIMAATVGGRLGVKASGGIRTAEHAIAMLDAGATRLGLSGTRAVLDGLPV